jgi:hypothetical protein
MVGPSMRRMRFSDPEKKKNYDQWINDTFCGRRGVSGARCRGRKLLETLANSLTPARPSRMTFSGTKVVVTDDR